jgi:hypothetical protein
MKNTRQAATRHFQPRISPDERAAHKAFIATLGPKPRWQDYEV